MFSVLSLPVNAVMKLFRKHVRPLMLSLCLLAVSFLLSVYLNQLTDLHRNTNSSQLFTVKFTLKFQVALPTVR